MGDLSNSYSLKVEHKIEIAASVILTYLTDASRL